MSRFITPLITVACLGILAASCGRKADTPTPPPAELEGEEWRGKAAEAVKKGLDFLESQDPKGEGLWMQSPGITAVVLLAHFQSGNEFTKTSHPNLWKGLDLLKSLQKPTGAIFDPREGNSNYVTSVSVLAMVLSGDAAYKETVNQAVKFLVDTQSTDETFMGGFGYQDKAKTKDKPYADIVNTEFALEALNRAGLDPSHPAWERAVTYLQRSQHNSEYNDAKWVSDIGDYRGGFVYHPGGESKAGTGPDAEGKDVLLPYGSVTYAGIKSMIYAHLDRDDPRVMAAVDWIKRNWTLEENPGFDVKRDKKLGKQGYYYYFMTFAKALHALGKDEITDSDFVKHNWRKELTERLVTLQAKNGSWKNTANERWMESHEPLATSYAVIALSFALMKN